MKKKFNVAAQVTHMALQVKDMQASIDFYKKWGGMEVIDLKRPDVKEETSVWLACPGQEEQFVIVLLPGGDGSPKAEGMRHIGLAVGSEEELREIADEADKAGLIHWPYQQHSYPVGTLFSIKDPDGYIVEFSYGQPLGLNYDAANDDHHAMDVGNLCKPEHK